MLPPLTRAPSHLLLAALASGCAHATGPAARQAAFNEQEYAQYAYAGTGTISVQVMVRAEGGQTRPTEGSQVSLNPVTSYSTEWWNRTVVGGLNLRSADEREQKYLRTALTDAQGRFVFSDLPRGEYFVVAALNTTAASTGTSGPSNSLVGQRVHLTEGGKVDLVLNDVHRTVAFARGPGTSAGEPAQLFQAGTEGATEAAGGADSTPSGRAPAVPPPPITLHPGVRQALALDINRPAACHRPKNGLVRRVRTTPAPYGCSLGHHRDAPDLPRLRLHHRPRIALGREAVQQFGLAAAGQGEVGQLDVAVAADRQRHRRDLRR